MSKMPFGFQILYLEYELKPHRDAVEWPSLCLPRYVLITVSYWIMIFDDLSLTTTWSNHGELLELSKCQNGFHRDAMDEPSLYSLRCDLIAIDQKYDRFFEVLKSLQQKNKIVEKENILKQSHQEGDPSDDVVDVVGPTNTGSLVKETVKPIEIEEDKANQAPSPFKNGEQHEKDDGIEKLSDIVVEEMLPLDIFQDLATQDASARTDEVPDMEMSLIKTIKRLSTRTGQPWHIVNEHKIPTDWAALKSSKEKTGIHSKCNMDCGIFVFVYAEYLSEVLHIPYSGIDAQYHRLRYATLLCKYESEKAENGYFSENDDPPRPRSNFAPKEIDRVLLIK
ncbi:hypothetical protein BC332_25237 [Capsicum chinense]|nr:hypothetical protein BC332_25237 [Capsicum chinense]